ncbi:MAG: tetrathionate reductase family octaheme c-type cytochrome [Anaerolineales bacterium]
MKLQKYIWLLGLTGTALIILVPLVLLWPKSDQAVDNPWANVPERPPHTEHTDLFEGLTLESGSDVTRACLKCHEDAAHQVMQTVHWTWESKPVQMAGRAEPITIGKKNAINNFCIGISSNWSGCTKCHAGYGWSDENFDFSNAENVDCLICHADPTTYAKGASGFPAKGVDLLVAAQSVGYPTRDNCGTCHFNGGGGNAVKHGDLDESLSNPEGSLDVHMGELNFQCTDCHQTKAHNITGRAISVSVDNANQIYCTDCHNTAPHEDARVNAHLDTVACQTCHIPNTALEDATKVVWDWSTAGQDIPEDPHFYLKIKGSFIYESNYQPQYFWYNGNVRYRYLWGDVIDPTQTTPINTPAGDITDPTAKIWPFKVHYAKQPYDTVYNYLVQPQTVGEYWVNFDWFTAITKGMETIGLPFSGEYGFAETIMYWPQTHMVQPAENALQCTACHAENGEGRLDWLALGYPGDPAEWGGRDTK